MISAGLGNFENVGDYFFDKQNVERAFNFKIQEDIIDGITFFWVGSVGLDKYIFIVCESVLKVIWLLSSYTKGLDLQE